MGTIKGFAWAKVNLGLRILDRRPDGFHELRTVFQTISLHDQIEVETAPGAGSIDLTCGAMDIAPENNLAYRAARAWLRASGSDVDVRIRVEKHIPTGAGLGGGSSDAAAVLLALQALHPGLLTAQQLFSAASSLGSDVPFFLVGGRAVGIGRGTETYALQDAPRSWYVVLAPDVSISTPWAYETLAASRQSALTHVRKEASIEMFCASVNAPFTALPEGSIPAVQNDFEASIFERHPRLRQCRDWLLEHGALEAFMTGSGAALIGCFPSEASARSVVESPATPTNSYVVHTVCRSECHQWWKTPDR